MKDIKSRLLAAIGAIVVTLGVFLVAASAQEAEWRHPGDLYSLQLDQSGWRAVPPERANLLAQFRPTNDAIPAICAIVEHHLPRWGTLTQDELNQRTAAFRPVADNRAISQLPVAETDSVAVAGFRFEDEISVGFVRVFFLAGSTGATAAEINCRMPLPTTSEREAAVLSFLNSLDFMQTDSAT
jgi:hypothetical protein